VEGTIMVQALVGKDGRVKDTKIVKSIPMLDQAAVDCVRQWVFKPALSKNQPVAVWVAVPIRFGSGNESPAPREREAPPPPPRETRARSIATRATLPEMLQRLRARGPVAPSDDDALLRERIIRTARRDAPEVPRLALESVQHARGTQDAPPEDRLRDLTLALDAAPWWAEPYREVGFVLIEMGRRAEARVSLELYLVADPDAYDWESVRLILNDLRRRIIDSN
jgi:TonB family protein